MLKSGICNKMMVGSFLLNCFDNFSLYRTRYFSSSFLIINVAYFHIDNLNITEISKGKKKSPIILPPPKGNCIIHLGTFSSSLFFFFYILNTGKIMVGHSYIIPVAWYHHFLCAYLLEKGNHFIFANVIS